MVRSASPGNYVDGNGLMLRVRKSGSRQWIQRLTIHGRRVDLGFGSAELVKLADARKVAADSPIRAGHDCVAVRSTPRIVPPAAAHHERSTRQNA